MTKATSVAIYAAIPAILGVGALYWLIFGQGLHSFDRQLSQEKREAVYVAAPEPIKAPMQFDVRKGAVTIYRATIDGGKLTVYMRNDTHDLQCFLQIHANLLSPDGTIINSIEEYAHPQELEPGEKAQAHFDMDINPSAQRVSLRMGGQSAC